MSIKKIAPTKRGKVNGRGMVRKRVRGFRTIEARSMRAKIVMAFVKREKRAQQISFLFHGARHGFNGYKTAARDKAI